MRVTYNHHELKSGVIYHRRYNCTYYLESIKALYEAKNKSCLLNGIIQPATLDGFKRPLFHHKITDSYEVCIFLVLK